MGFVVVNNIHKCRVDVLLMILMIVEVDILFFYYRSGFQQSKMAVPISIQKLFFFAANEMQNAS